MISRHSGTADTPRAHITNQRTMEALRDVGLEEACMTHASRQSSSNIPSGCAVWRVRNWHGLTLGNDPTRMETTPRRHLAGC